MSNDVEKRKKAVINWLKKPTNLLLVLIIIFGLFLRIHYWNVTEDQAIWWDEAEYMSAAKKWAFGVPYNLNPQRPPLFQFLSSIIFMSGLGESIIKLFLVVAPSAFLILSIYLLGEELYNKKIGLIAAFLSAVSWSFLFWTARIQPDFLSMSFQVLAILFMWKFWKNKKPQSIIWAGIFSAAEFYFKVSALLVPMSFVLFILIKDRFSAIKNKNYYIYSASFLLTLVPYFIWSYLSFGTLTAFKSGYSNALISSMPVPFGWYNLQFFYTLTQNVFFALFIIGIILGLKFLLYVDVLIKEKKKCFDPDIFGFIVLVVVASFYIFYIRGTEDRWVFLWLPFIFFFMGKTIMFIYENVKKYGKWISVVLCIGLLVWGGYGNLTRADDLIKGKISSYAQVKDSGIWIKENSEKDDLVWSLSMTQHTYYTERNVSNYNAPIETSEEFDEFVMLNRPRYIVASIFEPVNTPWLNEWVELNQDKVTVRKVYFADSAQTQAVLIIYEINYANY